MCGAMALTSSLQIASLIGSNIASEHVFKSSSGVHSSACTRMCPYSATERIFSTIGRTVCNSEYGRAVRQKQRICDAEASSRIVAKAVQKVEVAESFEVQKSLVKEVQDRLERDWPCLPIGRYGRDDEELLLWFLKDRKLNVDAAVAKLARFITWRKNFGVEKITEESVRNIAASGKAYLHKHCDREGRPVVVVVAAKHFPVKEQILDSEKLCVYLVEKALSQLRPGGEKILGIFDLRGFTTNNGDLQFAKFLVTVFYEYYPKRLGQVLFVDAPFIFQPGWNMIKPWLKSYSSLVRFCSASVVCEEYFTLDTAPPDFIL